MTEPKGEEVAAVLTTCPGCRRPVSSDDPECPYCGIVFRKVTSRPERASRTTAEQADRAPSRPGPSKWPAFSRSFLILGVALVVAAALGAVYYFHGPCGTLKVREAAGHLRPLLQEWDDADTLASSTSRIALSAPVARLQELRCRLDEVTVPKCMQPAHASLAEAMDETIAGYLSFMLNLSEGETANRFVAARAAMERFNSELEVALDCAPFCGSEHSSSIPSTMYSAESPTTAPTPRSGEFDIEITKILAVNNISGCGQYEFEATDASHTDYVVRCTADGEKWKSYFVSLPRRTVQPFDTSLPPEIHARRRAWERQQPREANESPELPPESVRPRPPSGEPTERPPDPNTRELARVAEQQEARRREIRQERARVQPAMSAWVSAQLLPEYSRYRRLWRTSGQQRSEIFARRWSRASGSEWKQTSLMRHSSSRARILWLAR